MIRKALVEIIVAAAHLLSWLIPKRRAKTLSMVKQKIRPCFSIETSHGRLRLAPQSYESRYLFGFHKHEPDLSEFIERLPKNSCFWDIGANVGLYSVFAALREDIRVMAFEPNTMSIVELNKNIEINNLSDRISAFPIAFGEKTSLQKLNMERLVGGDVSVQFGRDVDPFGDSLNVGFRQGAVGFSVDEFMDFFAPPFPTHVKIDVDGLEPEILRGGRKTFSSESVQAVIVEVLDGIKPHRRAAIFEQLESFGFAQQRRASETYRNVVFRRI